MNSVADLNSSNPLRPVDWRHRAAADRVASGLAFPRRDWDRETLVTALYLDRVRRGDDSRRLAAEFPDLHGAVAIHRNHQRGHRWAVEARLIAGIETASIAGSLGVDPAVVERFAAIFFDVGDRLKNSDFVMRRIIHRASNEPYDYRDRGWKLVGYLGGAEPLSQLLGRDPECALQGIVKAQCAATKLAIGDHIHRLVENGNPDRRLVQDLPQILAELAKGQLQELDEYCKFLTGILNGIEFRVLSRADLQDEPTSVEMRADEQWLESLRLPNPTWEAVKDITMEQIDAERALARSASVGQSVDGAAE